MGFSVIPGQTYNNATLGSTAVDVPVPTRVADRSGNAMRTIRVARAARIKNASSTNIVYVKLRRGSTDTAATTTSYDLMINPGLEDDIELEHATKFVSIIASASSTPVSISFGGQVF